MNLRNLFLLFPYPFMCLLNFCLFLTQNVSFAALMYYTIRLYHTILVRTSTCIHCSFCVFWREPVPQLYCCISRESWLHSAVFKQMLGKLREPERRSFQTGEVKLPSRPSFLLSAARLPAERVLISTHQAMRKRERWKKMADCEWLAVHAVTTVTPFWFSRRKM